MAVLSRVTAVLRARAAVDHAPVVDVLVDHGITDIELTFTTPRALEALAELRGRFGDAARLGMGTVTSVARTRAALDAGAQFIVTPGVLPEAARLARSRGVAVMMGALTPSEVMAALRAEADLVKIFPASAVGAGYLDQLRGPFPDLRAVPSGGLGPEEASVWLRAGAVGVSMGGPLIGDALSGGPIRELEERIRRTADALQRGVDDR